jgi:hypothetical protein
MSVAVCSSSGRKRQCSLTPAAPSACALQSAMDKQHSNIRATSWPQRCNPPSDLVATLICGPWLKRGCAGAQLRTFLCWQQVLVTVMLVHGSQQRCRSH